jgi:hypothetical protein
MHQQVRVMIQKSQDDAARGVVAEESLVAILSLLSGTNLRSAGRTRSDGGDEEFVFSVDHPPHDDTLDQQACDLLVGEGYEANLFKVKDFELSHRHGTLLECIQKLEAQLHESVVEVYVGAAERNGKIPVQLVTPSMLNR